MAPLPPVNTSTEYSLSCVGYSIVFVRMLNGSLEESVTVSTVLSPSAQGDPCRSLPDTALDTAGRDCDPVNQAGDSQLWAGVLGMLGPVGISSYQQPG
jgi:hypothetical protein